MRWRTAGIALLAAMGCAPVTASDDSLESLLARARAGDPVAQLNAGAAFDRGLLGAPPDAAAARRWYERAARAGVAEAQFNLAHLLVSQPALERPAGEARRWMARAARQGMPDAMWLYAVMLADGVDGAVDRAAARRWLERAAEAGQVDAADRVAALRDDD